MKSVCIVPRSICLYCTDFYFYREFINLQRSKNWLGGYPQISENLFWLPELSKMVPTQPYMLTSILSRNLDNRMVPTCIVHTEPLFLRYVQQRNKLHLVPVLTRWPKTTRHGLLIYFILVCSVCFFITQFINPRPVRGGGWCTPPPHEFFWAGRHTV